MRSSGIQNTKGILHSTFAAFYIAPFPPSKKQMQNKD